MALEDLEVSYRIDIRKRIMDMQDRGMLTSKGEAMSLAAIGRTLEPPVTRQTVCQVISGKRESARIKAAVEAELGQLYWVRRVAS